MLCRLGRVKVIAIPWRQFILVLNLLFANVPENLQVPHISTSSKDIPCWNRHTASYFGALFAFVKKNLHDDSVIVFTHAADPEVHVEIHDSAHTESWYMAKEWFGMNDLDLQSPTNPIGVVCHVLLIQLRSSWRDQCTYQNLSPSFCVLDSLYTSVFIISSTH